MDVDEFVHWWRSRDRDDLEVMAAALEATRETVDGEMGWLRATNEIRVDLRRAGRCRQAGAAAHLATVAAMRACTSAGMVESDPGRAALVARAAGDAAVGLVVGTHTASTDTVLRPFFGSMVLVPS